MGDDGGVGSEDGMGSGGGGVVEICGINPFPHHSWLKKLHFNKFTWIGEDLV